MQLTKEKIEDIRSRLVEVRKLGREYFAKVAPKEFPDEALELYKNKRWIIYETEDMERCEKLSHSIKELSVDIAAAARLSPLLADADMQELRHNTRQMLANLKINRYMHTGVFVHHDEGTVLGVDPPTHDEFPFEHVVTAADYFENAASKTLDIVDLLLTSEGTQLTIPGSANYEPNTAFIMMAIDRHNSELEDIKSAMIEVFQEFGIAAVVADDLQHEEAITDRILSEIQTREFLIADLTGERQNVYYEIGYAHALNKRPILVRKEGTKLHFDIAHRNCPEYRNLTALKKLLRKRLEDLMNRKPSL